MVDVPVAEVRRELAAAARESGVTVDEGRSVRPDRSGGPDVVGVRDGRPDARYE